MHPFESFGTEDRVNQIIHPSICEALICICGVTAAVLPQGCQGLMIRRAAFGELPVGSCLNCVKRLDAQDCVFQDSIPASSAAAPQVRELRLSRQKQGDSADGSRCNTAQLITGAHTSACLEASASALEGNNGVE